MMSCDLCRQKTPVDSEQEPSDDNEDEWTYPERKRKKVATSDATATIT